ncbi:MAG TPA: amino acid ABC transporter permease [Anaerolineaceae bacterium]|nr:amino acid ABC transporter permease [Anaerolineaceae bacterium]
MDQVQPNVVVKEKEPSSFDRWWLLFAAVILIIGALIIFQPDPYLRILNYVSDGIWVTIVLTAITFVLVLIFGLLVALARLSSAGWLKGIATVYVEVIRGIPLLVQLIFWYFAFPALIKQVGASWGIPAFANYQADAMTMAILGMAFCYTAYMSEVYRSGIQSISKGQMEAARSLGMNYFQAMRYVIIPQAIRVILPPVGNEFITLLKDTSLVSTVAVADMTRRGREFMASNFIPIQTWVMIALLYLVLTVLSERLVSFLERRFKPEK